MQTNIKLSTTLTDNRIVSNVLFCLIYIATWAAKNFVLEYMILTITTCTILNKTRLHSIPTFTTLETYVQVYTSLFSGPGAAEQRTGWKGGVLQRPG